MISILWYFITFKTLLNLPTKCRNAISEILEFKIFRVGIPRTPLAMHPATIYPSVLSPLFIAVSPLTSVFSLPFFALQENKIHCINVLRRSFQPFCFVLRQRNFTNIICLGF